MFDIGFSELVLIGIVALIVIGPERLPKVARTAGHLLGRFQRYVSNVKADISREMELDELRKAGQSFKESVETAARQTEQHASQTEAEFTLRDEPITKDKVMDALGLAEKKAAETQTQAGAAMPENEPQASLDWGQAGETVHTPAEAPSANPENKA